MIRTEIKEKIRPFSAAMEKITLALKFKEGSAQVEDLCEFAIRRLRLTEPSLTRLHPQEKYNIFINAILTQLDEFIVTVLPMIETMRSQNKSDSDIQQLFLNPDNYITTAYKKRDTSREFDIAQSVREWSSYPYSNILTLAEVRRLVPKKVAKLVDLGGHTGVMLHHEIESFDQGLSTLREGMSVDMYPKFGGIRFHHQDFCYLNKEHEQSTDILISNYSWRYFMYPDIALCNAIRMLRQRGVALLQIENFGDSVIGTQKKSNGSSEVLSRRAWMRKILLELYQSNCLDWVEETTDNSFETLSQDTDEFLGGWFAFRVIDTEKAAEILQTRLLDETYQSALMCPSIALHKVQQLARCFNGTDYRDLEAVMKTWNSLLKRVQSVAVSLLDEDEKSSIQTDVVTYLPNGVQPPNIVGSYQLASTKEVVTVS